MKSVFVFAMAMLMSVSSFAQGGKDIYNRYSGKDGVSAVYISPTMFSLIKEIPDIQLEGEDINLSSVIKTFDGMYILDVEDGTLAGKLNGEISDMVEKGRYELLMEAADSQEKVRIYIMREGESVTDFLMAAHEDGCSTSVISISGNIPMAELQKILAQAVE